MRAVGAPDEYPETGQCVHKFTLHPARPEVLYQQNHSGAYRSFDGGLAWEDMNDGLPSHFGFPIAVHPHDPKTIWTVPLNGDDRGRYMPEGRATVWRSRDEGDSWQPGTDGLPQARVRGRAPRGDGRGRSRPRRGLRGHLDRAALREPRRGHELAPPR